MLSLQALNRTLLQGIFGRRLQPEGWGCLPEGTSGGGTLAGRRGRTLGGFGKGSMQQGIWNLLEGRMSSIPPANTIRTSLKWNHHRPSYFLCDVYFKAVLQILHLETSYKKERFELRSLGKLRKGIAQVRSSLRRDGPDVLTVRLEFDKLSKTRLIAKG